MISVCMATHNGEKYIKEQIDSILCQLSDSDELIISDDGSTDSTLDIITQYNDKRIRIIRFTHHSKYYDSFATHRYASKNFENAIKNAQGEYIFLCDQDDIWMPNKVSKCVEALNKSLLVKHNGIMVDENGKSLQMESSKTKISKYLLTNLYYMRIPGSHIAFKRELLQIALPFPKDIVSHDAWLGCLASYIGKCANIDIPLIKYRIHNNNVSVHKHNNFFVMLTYRINLIKQIIFRIIKIKTC